MSAQLLLESHLKTLRLPTMLREYPQVVRQAAEADDSYELFLQHLAEREVAARESKSIARRLKQAGFPASKELSDFDFSAVPKLNKKLILELARGEFLELKTNIVLVGAPGLGKTHLAISLGREYLRRGARTAASSALGSAYSQASSDHHRRTGLYPLDQNRRRESL